MVNFPDIAHSTRLANTAGRFALPDPHPSKARPVTHHIPAVPPRAVGVRPVCRGWRRAQTISASTAHRGRGRIFAGRPRRVDSRLWIDPFNRRHRPVAATIRHGGTGICFGSRFPLSQRGEVTVPFRSWSHRWAQPPSTINGVRLAKGGRFGSIGSPARSAPARDPRPAISAGTIPNATGAERLGNRLFQVSEEAG